MQLNDKDDDNHNTMIMIITLMINATVIILIREGL